MALGFRNLPQRPQRTVEHFFSKPIEYHKRIFGIKTQEKDEQVSSYSLEVSVTQMSQDFRIFEEMPNVHEWPVSKLIQRELDKHRASMIGRDYLLSDGYLKYFPPITAVLIPTANDMIPTDAYGAALEEELSSIKSYVMSAYEENFGAQFVTDDSIKARGIYDVDAGGGTGLLVWDKNAVNAVIIDGQHRYKSLLEAMSINGEFQACRVSINIIDLVPLCQRRNVGPTSVARDLFVSINNTPVEVDEARLVLMDDRDALATFTQALVDDSDPEKLPAVPPELIDWRCDQGKHDVSLALTGVLTIRGVIGAAMFGNTSVASVDDRSNKKHVDKWLRKVEAWVDPDDEITLTLGASETLRHRFKVASAAGDFDAEDQQPFLFSYGSSVAVLMKNRFRDLYLPVFRTVFSEFYPYSQVHKIAEENAAFSRNTALHRYLRAFSSQRYDMLRGNIDLAGQIGAFKTHLRDHAASNILLTVMGQKSVFKALFDECLSSIDIETEVLAQSTHEFIEVLNGAYEKLHASVVFDECFFSTGFSLRRGVQTARAGDLGRSFWRGIILGNNGEIDYGPTSVDILKAIVGDIYYFQLSGEDQRPNDFIFSERSKIVKRHQSILQKNDREIDDDDAIACAEEIVAAKEKVIFRLLTE